MQLDRCHAVGTSHSRYTACRKHPCRRYGAPASPLREQQGQVTASPNVGWDLDDVGIGSCHSQKHCVD